MSTTGQQLLGRHLYDILSPNDPQVMTLGNYSNSAYITFYTSNDPIFRGYNIGLCNNSFVILNNNYTSMVGINTNMGRSTLDVHGMLAVNSITNFSNIGAIHMTNTTLSNIRDITFQGYIYRQGKPFIAPWTNVNPTEYIETDIYTTSNVGIKSAVPRYALDVDGSVQFTNRLLRNGVEYKESPFQYLIGNAQSNSAPYDIQLSNMFYLHNVGIGTNSCNELVRYKLFVQGDVAIDGKLYATDYVSYSGSAANSYKSFEIYGINPNYETRTIRTNDTNPQNTVLYEFGVKAGRYLIFANIPYINRSPFIFVDNQNWADVVLCQTDAASYTSTTATVSKVPLEIRSVNIRNTQTIEFFVDATTNVTYTIAVRGKGHTLEFGGVSVDELGRATIDIDQSLRVFPVKGIGYDDSFTVKKALQITPIRRQEILTQDTSNFVFSTLGNYTTVASNVDVFINGIKYVYYNNTKKDYDVDFAFNTTTQFTTFTISLTEPAQQNDVIDISIWPYATADTLYSSGYYYQQINTYPTQWLNVVNGSGIRYPRDVVVDGNLIVRGNIVGGCNTDVFTAGLPTGDLTISCNVVGTLNIIDGSITLGKLGPNSINNEKILTNTIHPNKLDLKNRIFYVGCNFGEVSVSEDQIPRQRGLYVDGDVFIKGAVQATVFQGSTESLADNSITTAKYRDLSITYPKIAYYTLSNLLFPDKVINNRLLDTRAIATSNYIPRSVSTYQLALGSVMRSNIYPRSITSNELDIYSVSVGNLNLQEGYLGIGTMSPQEKVHIVGNVLVNGTMYPTTTHDIGIITQPYSNIYLQGGVNLNGDVTLRKASTFFAPTKRGIEIVDSTGAYVKNVFGDMYAGNIGIGITNPISGIDVGFGNILLRNGTISIGRNTVNPSATIDALTPVDSTLLINKIGVGTDILDEPLMVTGGGMVVNSNDTYFVFRGGNVGIGTAYPVNTLQVVNGTTLFDTNNITINQGNVSLTNGILNITKDTPGDTTFITNGTVYLETTYTCNIVPYDTSSSIGDDPLPYLNVYTSNLVIGNTTTDYGATTISPALSAVYSGDGYNLKRTISIGAQEVTVYPPLEIGYDTYIRGGANFNNFFPYRNYVINGDMRFNQRYTNTTSTITQGTVFPSTYTLDRHETVIRNSTGQLIVGQSNISTSAFGFNPITTYYQCKVGVSTASLNANAVHTLFSHKIENTLTNTLGWGTPSPIPITVSFDMISTITHTYYLSVHNADRNRSYLRDIPVSASTSPTRYSFTIQGDALTTANWRNPNTVGSPYVAYGSNDVGIIVSINTGVGASLVSATSNSWLAGTYYGRESSTSFVSTTNTNVNITNFQVEAGYYPTVFEKRHPVLELQLCQRYYEKSYAISTKPGTANVIDGIQLAYGTASGVASDWICGTVPFKIPKRLSNWRGSFWNCAGTADAISIRQTSGNYALGSFGTQLAASNTPFGTKSENNYAYHFLVSIVAGRAYAWHWAIDAEI